MSAAHLAASEKVEGMGAHSAYSRWVEEPFLPDMIMIEDEAIDRSGMSDDIGSSTSSLNLTLMYVEHSKS